jgi:tRNA(fMet)-specific endonuclease VapC
VLFHFDTNAISDLIQQDPRVLARLAASRGTDEIRMCVVVRGEILFGINRLPPGKRQNDLRQRAESIFGLIGCEPIRASASEHYARMKCALEKVGSSLGENDLWIGACALESGAVLITRDLAFKH